MWGEGAGAGIVELFEWEEARARLDLEE